MVEIELVLPEFIKRVCPDCKIWSHIKGKYGLAGYVLKNANNEYFYLTYIRNPFYTEKKIGIDKSILLEANARFKATIVKAMPDPSVKYRFFACDAKQWYRYVIKHDSWRPTTDENEDLGNIPITMFYDMEAKEERGLGVWGIK